MPFNKLILKKISSGSLLLLFWVSVLLLVSCGKSDPRSEPNAKIRSPNGIVVNSGTRAVKLLWSGVPGATKYSVYWSSKSGINLKAANSADVTDPLFVHSGLSNGIDYFYAVTAHDDAGESAMSNVVVGHPHAAPPEQPVITVIAGDRRATINYSPVIGGERYRLYWGTGAGIDENSQFIDDIPYTFVHAGLTNGTDYYYRLYAINEEGNGTFSEEQQVTAQKQLPVAPVITAATVNGNNQLSITWVDVGNAESYSIYWGNQAGVTTADSYYNQVQSPFAIPVSNAGAELYFRVRAMNSAGTSELSNEVHITYPLTLNSIADPGNLPPVPQLPIDNVVANDSQLTLTWNTDSASQGYNIYWKKGTTQLPATEPVLTKTASEYDGIIRNVLPPYTHIGLNNGNYYYYKVAAINNAGESDLSNLFEIKKPEPIAAGVPSGLNLSAADEVLQLFWSAVQGAASYQIKISPIPGNALLTDLDSNTNYTIGVDGISEAIVISNSSPSKIPPFIITNLTNGTSYTVQVRVASPLGAWSNPVTAAPIEPVPNRVNGLAAASFDQSSLLTWEAAQPKNIDDPDEVITGYNIYQSESEGVNPANGTLVGNTDASNLQFNVTGLDNGRRYYFTVAAVNIGGQGDPAIPVWVEPQAARPDAPSGFSAQAGDAQVLINFTPAADTSLTYNLYWNTALPTGRSTTQVISNIPPGYVFNNNVINGTTYYFRIAASNTTGQSSLSREIAATPQVPPPSNAPINVALVPSSGQVVLSWDSVANATGYKIFWSTDTNIDFLTSPVENVFSTGFTHRSLQNGLSYYYQIRAYNPGGLGPASEIRSAQPQVDPPLMPDNFTLVSGNSEVTLTWLPANDAESYTVYWHIDRNETNLSLWNQSPGASPGHIIGNLVNGNTYYFQLRARNPGGFSPATAIQTGMPQIPRPDKPLGLSAASGDQSVSVNWHTVAGVSYDLYWSTGTVIPYPNGTLVQDVSPIYVHGQITPLVNGDSYRYQIVARNAGGNSDASDIVESTPQQPVTGAPNNLSAEAAPDSVTLRWNPVSNEVAGTTYTLYWGTSSAVATQLNSAQSFNNVNSPYIHSGRTLNQTYYYVVTATAPGAAQSAPSNIASATPVPDIPVTPSTLTVVSGIGSNTISWSNVANAAQYQLQWSLLGDFSDAQDALIDAPSTQYLHSGLSNGTPVFYRLLASNQSGQSGFTNIVSATPFAQPQPTNTPPLASSLSITDSNSSLLIPGVTLLGDYIYTDAESDVEGNSHYQWYRAGTPISGANSISYVLTSNDENTVLSFEVTPVAKTGASPGLAVSVQLDNSNSPPVASNVAIVNGNLDHHVGDVLVGTYIYSDPESNLEGISVFRWYRDDVIIAGASSKFYAVSVSDSGHQLKFEVEPRALYGDKIGSAVISAPTNIINSPPTATNLVIVDNNGGNLTIGDRLSSSFTYLDVDGDSPGSHLYQWYRNTLAIQAANSPSYTVTANDIGSSISLELTPIALTGDTTGTPVRSNSIGSNALPVLVVPANITVAAVDAAGTPTSNTAISNFLNGASCSDAEDGSIAVSYNAPNVFPLGVTNISFSCTDSASNTVATSASVNITDQTVPTVTAPANIALNAAVGANSVPASDAAIQSFLNSASATDNVDGAIATITNDAPAAFPIGTTVVAFSATDFAGNIGSATASVTVNGNGAPVVTAPTAITVAAVDATGTPATNATIQTFLGAATCNDPQDGVIATINNDAPAQFALGATTVTFSCQDSNSNVANATSTVTVTDQGLPVVTPPAAITVAAIDANGTPASDAAIQTFLNAASCVDAVDGPISPLGNNAPITLPLGNTSVQFSCTDTAGNNATANASISVTDQTLPTVTAPANLSLTVAVGATTIPSTDAAIQTFLNAASATDNVDGTIATVTNDAPANFPVGSTLVTFSATDTAGNNGTASATVTVNANGAPVVTPPAAIIVAAVDATGTPATNATIQTFLGAATCTDPQDGVITTITNDAPTQFPLAATTVTFSCQDTNSNISTATSTVTVTDQSVPTVTPPAAVTVAAINASGTPATDAAIQAFLNGASCSDVIDGAIATISNNAPATFPLGATSVQFSCSDLAGNIGTANATLSVTDQTLPTVTAPANIVLLAAVGASSIPNTDPAIVAFLNGASASDNVDTTLTISNDAPANFPLGVTTVTFSATDLATNTGQASATVTVNANDAPVLSVPAAATIAAVNASGTPLNDAAVQSFLTSASCTDTQDGAITPINDAPAQFALNATVTINFSCTDTDNNTVSNSSSITINDLTLPIVTAPTAITVAAVDASGTPNTDTAIAAFLGGATCTDNVDGAITSITNNAPTTIPLGTTTVTFSCDDLATNTGTATASIVVSDQTPPVVTAPANITVTAPVGSTSVPDTQTDIAAFLLGATITDNVDTNLSATTDAPANFPVGVDTVVTFTANDSASNVGFDTATVSVISNSAPIITALTLNDATPAVTSVGEQITATFVYQDADSDIHLSTDYQWLRNGADITDPIASGNHLPTDPNPIAYTLTNADSGATISVRLIANAATGVLQSIPTEPLVTLSVNSLPTATISILDSIGQVATSTYAGQALTASYTYTDVDPQDVAATEASVTWFNAGTQVATGLTYTVAATDTSLHAEVTPYATFGSSPGLTASSAAVSVTAPPGITQNFYGFSSGKLVSVNGADGSVSPISGIGMAGFTSIRQIEYDYTSKLIYAINVLPKNSSASLYEFSELVTIDPVSGAKNVVAYPGPDYVNSVGLALDPVNRKLYSINSNGDLFSFDLNNNTSTLVNNIGFTGIKGLAMDVLGSGQLYAVESSTARLLSISSAGIATPVNVLSTSLVAPQPQLSTPVSLTFDHNTGKILAVMPVVGIGISTYYELMSIDTTTAIASSLGGFDNGSTGSNTYRSFTFAYDSLVANNNSLYGMFGINNGTSTLNKVNLPEYGGQKIKRIPNPLSTLNALAYDSFTGTTYGMDAKSKYIMTYNAGGYNIIGQTTFPNDPSDINAIEITASYNILYAVTYNSLYAINLLDFSATKIGTISPATSIIDLAFDPAANAGAGAMYGLTSTNNLVTIDLQTAAVSAGVPISTASVYGIGVAQNGQLYGLTFYRHIYTIDPSTGTATDIAPTFSTSLTNKITFAGNQLLATIAGTLRGVDITDLTQLNYIESDLAFYSYSGNITGFAIDYDSNTFYVTAGTGLKYLYQVDPSTGISTRLGSITSAIEDLAYDPVTKLLYGMAAQSGANKLLVYIRTSGAEPLDSIVGLMDYNTQYVFGNYASGITFDSLGTLYSVYGVATSPSDMVSYTVTKDAGNLPIGVSTPTLVARLPASNGGSINYNVNSDEFLINAMNQPFNISTVTHAGKTTRIGESDVRDMEYHPLQDTLYHFPNSNLNTAHTELSTTTVMSLGKFTSRGLAIDSSSGSLYVVDTSTNNLLRVDPISGQSTVIGYTELNQLRGIVYNPLGAAGEHIIGYDITAGSFVTIDPATGTATIRPSVSASVSGIAVNANNSIYVNTGQGIALLDTGTFTLGATTSFVDPLGAPFTSSVLGLGINSTNQAYAIAQLDNSDYYLIDIDLATGVVTHTGKKIGFSYGNYLAIDKLTDTIYSSEGDFGQLISINPGTGAGTTRGGMNYYFNQIGYSPSNTTYYTASASANRILYSFDPATGNTTFVNGFYADGIAALGGFAVDPNSLTFYSSNGTFMSVFDLTSSISLVAFNIPGQTFFVNGMSWNSNSNSLYGLASTNSLFTITDIPTATGTMVGTSIGTGAYHELVHVPTSNAFVTIENENTLVVINETDGTVITRVPLKGDLPALKALTIAP